MHPTCIQYQFHRGHITPVNAWGAIRYGYKSPLLFVHGTSKSGAFKKVDYLAQVLDVSRSAGCFGCYVTCPNAVSSRVIHLVFQDISTTILVL
jgi:hypothetical protein